MKRAVALAVLAQAACSSTDAISTPITGAPPLCAPGVALGAVAVAPLTRWRPDQKEKERREAIARKAIETAFRSMPCARSVKLLGIAPDAQSAAKLAEAKSGGADTAVLIRIDELGPILIISVPVLWSTWSDIKFGLEEVDVATGQTLLKFDHHRKVGGAFQVRGVGPLEGEMETALRELIVGPAAK